MSVIFERKLKKAALKDYGYRSREDFVRDAVRHRFLELRKADFFAGVATFRKAMRKQGLTEAALLKDFDRFSRR